MCVAARAYSVSGLDKRITATQGEMREKHKALQEDIRHVSDDVTASVIRIEVCVSHNYIIYIYLYLYEDDHVDRPVGHKEKSEDSPSSVRCAMSAYTWICPMHTHLVQHALLNLPATPRCQESFEEVTHRGLHVCARSRLQNSTLADVIGF